MSREILGLAADVFQHEINHLDGVILDDIGLEIDDDFLNATDEEKQAIIDMYLDSLDLKQKALEKEIQETPELKQMDDAIKFIDSVAKGETKLETISQSEESKE